MTCPTISAMQLRSTHTHPCFRGSFILFFCLIGLFPYAGLAQGLITGQLADRETGEWLEFVSVGLKKKGSDQFIKGTTSGDEGKFEISGIADGEYQLEVVFVGYEKKIVEAIRITERQRRIQLGKVLLASTFTQLDEIVIEGSPPFMQSTIDGLKIKADANLSGAGGSLLDILRNTPSVNVGFDGGISLRGSNSTNILINGRNTSLSGDLDQIPASAVESIEIITNPGPKYDAEGQGGVINIILKEDKKKGTNGSVEFSMGSGLRSNSSLSLNHNQNKVSLWASYDFRRSVRRSDLQIDRFSFGNNPAFLEQRGNDFNVGLGHVVKTGIEYTANKKNKLTYEVIFNTYGTEGNEAIRSDIFYEDPDRLPFFNTRFNNQDIRRQAVEQSLTFVRQFDQKNRKLTANLTYSLAERAHLRDLRSDFFDEGRQNLTFSGFEQTFADSRRHLAVAQIDYIQPLGNFGKMETGVKTILREIDTDFAFREWEDGSFIDDPLRSNRFIYQEQVHAAYVNWSHKINQWELSAGVRSELTHISTELVGFANEPNRQFIDLFPGFKALYRFDEHHAFKATYSRRINRPSPRNLNPFPDLSDSLNIRSGNPLLMPEYTNSFELGHLWDKKGFSLATTLFYRETSGIVDYLNTMDEGIAFRRPENLNNGITYGIELVGQAEILPWWRINGSYSFFHYQVDGSNLSDDFVNQNVGWSSKIVSDMELPYRINFQVTGNYTAPEAEAQGFEAARYYIDLGLQRKIWKDQFDLRISVRDIFDTFQRKENSQAVTFLQERIRKDETRIIMCTLRYNFK